MLAPFDIATSHALALNTCDGDTAVQIFETTRTRAVSMFRIQIHEVVAGSDTGPREIVDTVCPTVDELLLLVEDLLMEMRSSEEDPDGK